MVFVKQANFAAAKDRITELETAWDQAEEAMRPMSPDDWATVDKSIDRALSQVRSGKPDAAGCEAALNTMIAKMNSISPVPGSSASTTTKGGPLGDLAEHLQIASDTLKLAESGDLKAAKDRAKALEASWDSAQEKIKPMSPEDWNSVDKSIDRALAVLRSESPNPVDCITALKTLIAKLDSLQKGA